MPLNRGGGSWPTIDPGSFRHLITLLEQTLSTGSAGMAATWQPGNPPVQAWAEISYVRGIDIIRGGLEITQNFVEITLHYQPAFATNGRIQGPTGKVYLIQSIENVNEMNMFLVLRCLGLGSNN